MPFDRPTHERRRQFHPLLDCRRMNPGTRETSAWSRLSKVWTVWYATRRIPRRSARSRNPGSTCSACGQTLDPLRPLAALTMPLAGEYRRPRPSPYRFRPRQHDGLRLYLYPPDTPLAAAGARIAEEAESEPHAHMRNAYADSC